MNGDVNYSRSTNGGVIDHIQYVDVRIVSLEY